MKIHPTAIISPQAELHTSVVVGPYSLIEREVCIGADCEIGSSVRIYQGTCIGQANRVDHGAVLGCTPQDYSFDPKQVTHLEIGNYNCIREGANIHRGTTPEHATQIGNHNYIMGTFHVGHDCEIGNHNTLGHGTVLAGHVLIGNYVFISGIAAIHQFCSIGDYAMIAGCSKIVKDVPPFTTADGNPASIIGLNTIALRRSGIPIETRSALKRIYKQIYHGGKLLRHCLEEIKTEKLCLEEKSIVAFFEKSQRGVTRHR